MVFAHFASGGREALDLPAWALAYGVFAVSVIVVLVSRQRHVARPRPVDTESLPPRPARAATRIGTMLTGVIPAVAFWCLVALCAFGPESLGQNLGPLVLIGVLWSLGGWIAAAFGWCWEALDPFAVFATNRERPDTAIPTWVPIPVFAAYVVIWVAWISGDEPRHLAIWLTLYGAAMITVARVGGIELLRAVHALPTALDLTAAVTRPRTARRRTRERSARVRVGIVSAMLLGAIGANRVAATSWFTTDIEPHGTWAVGVMTMAVFAASSAGIGLVWWGCQRPLESARGEPGTRPLAAILGPVAGGVLAAQALPIGLIQIQNFLVLVSDPFAQGWNLFGTVYRQVTPRLVSPFVQGLIQVAGILAGHAAALSMIGHAATERTAEGATSPARRNRYWMAATPAMGAIVVGGVVWTLVLLG